MLLFPAIDLYEGKAVRLYKGDYNQLTVYNDNPADVGKAFAAAGAKHIHVVDLEGAKSGTTPNLEIVAQVEGATGMSITADHYARPEKCKNPDLERFFRWKEQIGCTVHEDFSEATFGPELAHRVAEYLAKVAPLYHYFNRFKV